MADEHDDDLEPEVTEGAEVEVQSYGDVTDEVEDNEAVDGDDESDHPLEDEPEEDDASDSL